MVFEILIVLSLSGCVLAKASLSSPALCNFLIDIKYTYLINFLKIILDIRF